MEALTGELGCWPEAARLELLLGAATAGVDAADTAAPPAHSPLAELDELAAATDDEDGPVLDGWLATHGWRAMRDLHLEAEPFRTQRAELTSRIARVRDSPAAAGRQRVGSSSSAAVRDELLGRPRRLTSLREQVSADRALVHASIRALAWTLGEQLVAAGAIPAASHVFELRLPRLLALARGGPPPARAGTEPARGVARAERGAARRDTAIELHGQPVSAGAASGRLLLLETPRADVDADGAIIVCSATDPAWMVLLTRCSGLVAERGGPLSHAAIVARELGVPAVVGVAGARAAASGRERGTLDGSSGRVRFDGSP